MICIRDIDDRKYHTFFLEYYKFSSFKYNHLIRPSKATYEQIIDTSKPHDYALEGAVVTFDYNQSISQILLECAVLGITVDFIEIKVPCDLDISNWDDYRTFAVIDTHKDDVQKYIDIIKSPRHYLAMNKKRSDILKFLVVDSTLQDSKMDFMKGDYDRKAVVAGFRERADAIEMCKKLNGEN